MKDVECNIWWIATKIILGFLGAGVILSKPCFAQSTITPDNTLGTEASQVTPNVTNPDGIQSELIEVPLYPLPKPKIFPFSQTLATKSNVASTPGRVAYECSSFCHSLPLKQ